MLDPTAEYILLFMVFAVVLAALAVLVRAVVATTSGCMSIPLKAVAFGERVKRLFSRQPAISTQRAKALTGKGSAKTLPVIHLDKATACQRGSADRQGPMPSTEGVATGRRPNSINDSGPPEGGRQGVANECVGLTGNAKTRLTGKKFTGKRRKGRQGSACPWQGQVAEVCQGAPDRVATLGDPSSGAPRSRHPRRRGRHAVSHLDSGIRP